MTGEGSTDLGRWNITEGMRVYDSEGKDLGTVSKVWPDTEAEALPETGSENLGKPDTTNVRMTSQDPGFIGGPSISTGGFVGAQGYETPKADEPLRTAGGGFVKVDRGTVLGIGGRDFYLPFGAIASVDDAVHLNVTEDEASDRGWHSRPPGLED